MTVRTDAISRWIMLRYASVTGPGDTERFLESVRGLITMGQADPDREELTTSNQHVTPDGRYAAYITTSLASPQSDLEVRTRVHMRLTHADGWDLDPEGGLSVMGPESIRRKHMDMVTRGELRLTDVMQAEDLTGIRITQMASVGDHAIYKPTVRRNLSWDMTARMATERASRTPVTT